MADEQDRFISLGDGCSFSLGSLAGTDLHPQNYKLLYQASEDIHRDEREYLLARITPGERIFIAYMCRHPAQTDQEAMAALGLRESTILAYYAHLDRNFKVHNSSELRRWAFENRLLSMIDDGPEEDAPDKDFDPWVRWY